MQEEGKSIIHLGGTLDTTLALANILQVTKAEARGRNGSSKAIQVNNISAVTRQ